jgi:adenylate cyclase
MEPQGRRKLAAILAADAAGYSRLMAEDDRTTVALLDSCRGVFRGHVESRQGRVVDMAGDSVLAVFETASGAVEAALSIQQELEGAEPACELRFRIGVHIGEVLEKPDGTIYGDGVNVAARLQALASPGEVAISDMVQMAVRGRVQATFIDRGEQAVKNIPARVHWYCAAAAPRRQGATDPVRRTQVQVATLPSIAILPFRTAAADGDHLSLADGLRLDIQQVLVKMAGIIVIGVATTNSYRHKEVTPQQAAAEISVRYLLEGFVQKAGGRARITMSLLDCGSGQVLWSERYDRALDNTFDVQDEIAEHVVTAVDVKLMSGEQARVWRKTIKDPKAREHYYRGIHEFLKGQKEANAFARGNFEEAARLAPTTSLGHTMVAFTHWIDAFRGWTPTPTVSFDAAAQWAERAMAMEDADGQAHTVMGHIHLLRREHEKALQVAEQAVTIRPACTNANAHLANIFFYCGRPADAADRMRQVMRISPVHPPWMKLVLAASYKELGQWDSAAQLAGEIIRVKPDDIDARLILAETAQARGDRAGAREFAGEIQRLHPDFSLPGWAERQPYRERGVLERIVASLRDAGLS